MLYYCSMTTAGSILGCLLLFLAGRKGGEVLLKKRFAQDKIDRVEKWYGQYGVFAVMIPSILPPPTPFKIFVLFAGAFQINTGRFLFAIAVGRGFRYFLEGILAVKYGVEAMDYMHRNYTIIALMAVLAIALMGLAIYLGHRWRTPPVQRS